MGDYMMSSVCTLQSRFTSGGGGWGRSECLKQPWTTIQMVELFEFYMTMFFTALRGSIHSNLRDLIPGELWNSLFSLFTWDFFRQIHVGYLARTKCKDLQAIRPRENNLFLNLWRKTEGSLWAEQLNNLKRYSPYCRMNPYYTVVLFSSCWSCKHSRHVSG
jgi:hypothetical protein